MQVRKTLYVFIIEGFFNNLYIIKTKTEKANSGCIYAETIILAIYLFSNICFLKSPPVIIIILKSHKILEVKRELYSFSMLSKSRLVDITVDLLFISLVFIRSNKAAAVN